MEVTLENTGPSTTLLKVQISALRVKQSLDEYYAHLAPRAKVAGFRPGKVPRAILEKNFHEEAKQEVISHAIPDAYQEIVADKKLKPALPPLVTKIDWQLDDSLYFEAQVDLVPAVKLPSYKGIAVEITDSAVQDKDVVEALDHLREKNAQLIPLTERGLAAGDVVIVDQKVSVGEHVLDQAKDAIYDMHEKRLSPEVYKGLLGAKVGETREVTTVVPADYPKKEHAGKPATVHLSVKEVKEKKLPELDDAFAKDVGEYANLAALKDQIRQNLEQYQKDMQRLQTESKINEFLLANTTMDLPKRLVQKQTKHMMEAAIKKGEAHVKPEADYIQNMEKRAEEQLKLYFILATIAEAEKIQPTEAQLDEKIAEIAKKVGQGVSLVRDYYKKDGRLEDLRERLQSDQVADFLIAQAKIKTATKA